MTVAAGKRIALQNVLFAANFSPAADVGIWCEPNCYVKKGAEGEKITEVAVAHEIVATAPCPVLTFRA